MEAVEVALILRDSNREWVSCCRLHLHRLAEQTVMAGSAVHADVEMGDNTE
jgi:hypothetical protein